MKTIKFLFLILVFLGISVVASGCNPTGPCNFSGFTDLTVYRLPDPSSDVFGTLPAGESHEMLARTADGWIGFDPGIAQAGNSGLARHRWVKMNGTLSPSCLTSPDVEVVTLAQVMADMPVIEIVPPAPDAPPPQSAPETGAEDLIITQVVLVPAILVENQYSRVEVTVENQGDAAANGYSVTLFPEYGTGSQTQSAQDLVSHLPAGDSQMIPFPQGIIYGLPGTYTLRVLVTDDTPTNNLNPDSIGTAGDYKDVDIQVILDQCNPFADKVVSIVTLNLPADTRILPFYIKVEGGFEGDPPKLNASFGEFEAYQCGLQGFDDRVYCLVHVPEGHEGLAKLVKFWVEDCPNPAFTQDNFLIPIPQLICTADLGRMDCSAAGGSYEQVGRTSATYECVCP